MHNKSKVFWFSSDGFTLIEVVISIALLGIVIIPIMNLFVMSARINYESDNEYKSCLAAQKYIEEIKATPNIDTNLYVYDSKTGIYKRRIEGQSEKHFAEIEIIPEEKLLNIVIKMYEDENVIYTLSGSKLIWQ